MTDQCNVCGTALMPALYDSGAGASLTSLCRIVDTPTRVRACPSCAHIQTDEAVHAPTYYDKEYNILVESEDEDQIYEVVEGAPVFRTAHQVAVLLRKLQLDVGMRLLDYGCAKSSTYRALAQARPDVDLHLFDVSDRYVPFWSTFLKADRWSTYEPRREWSEYFDVVTSFFAFEHIPDPVASLRIVSSLLRPDGRFYCIVPNVLTNVADLVVVDHVNHFTRTSILKMFSDAGFGRVDIDDTAHRGAFVIVAEKSPAAVHSAICDGSNVAALLAETRRLGEFWLTAAQRAREFECTLLEDDVPAIYGAGFYGAFLVAALERPERIRCLIDQNPHLQGRIVNGRQVVHPSSLPSDITVLMIGLNPANARAIIEQLESLRALRKFFL